MFLIHKSHWNWINRLKIEFMDPFVGNEMKNRNIRQVFPTRPNTMPSYSLPWRTSTLDSGQTHSTKNPFPWYLFLRGSNYFSYQVNENGNKYNWTQHGIYEDRFSGSDYKKSHKVKILMKRIEILIRHCTISVKTSDTKISLQVQLVTVTV